MLYAKKETLLKVENVSLSLGGKVIVRDINMEIKDIVRPDTVQGQIVSLVGLSGVGKSTLFSMLSGVRKPDTGTILAGQNLSPVKIGDMGVVYQNYYLYDWRRVSKILKMSASKNPEFAGKSSDDAIKAIAADFGFEQCLNSFPKELSGGQKQRVAIAEQILNGSEFILLDEPFSGLDVFAIEKVVKTLLKTSCIDELKTIIIVSHNIPDSVAISDTVYVMAKEPGKEGGTIVRSIDLIERDLVWHPDVKQMPRFTETISEVKSLL